jgi:hypothetical protein
VTGVSDDAGPRWGVLLPVLAIIGLFLVVLLALRSDRSDGREPETEVPRGPRPEPNGDPLRALAAASTPPPRGWRTELVDVPHAGRLYGVGARAHLAGSPETGSDTGAVYVTLGLFAEGQRRRWETDPLDGGAPFSASVANLEEDIKEIVVPARLPTLVRALANAGVDIDPADLEVLPFMLELSPELEKELVRRGLPGDEAGPTVRRLDVSA